MRIIKRNGTEVVFDVTKIIIAVTKANETVDEADRLTAVQIQRIAENVELQCQKMHRSATVEEVQDMVEHHIMAHGAYEVAKHYITYRYTRSLVRTSNTTDDRILELIECGRSDAPLRRSDSGAVLTAAQRDRMADEVSRDITERILLPRDVVEAHRDGILHFHSAGHFAQHMHAASLISLDDMLQNGTVLAGAAIEPPRSFSTACIVAVQIAAHIAANQYGGLTMSLAHLAPFVDVSRQKLRASLRDEFDAAGVAVDSDQVAALAKKRLRAEIRRGVQSLLYQAATSLTAGGKPVPLTLLLSLSEARHPQERLDMAMVTEELLQQRCHGMKGAGGGRCTAIFPRLVYVLEEDNMTREGAFRHLTAMAAKCTAECGTPEYISAKMLSLQTPERLGPGCCACMDKGAFLPPYVDAADQARYYGRFRQGMVTLNLADAALSSGGNFDRFWKLMDERLELCRRALLCRHERLKGTLSDTAPVLWQYGGCARLQPGESVDKLLYGGYSDLSLSYAGLYECVRCLTGKAPADTGATPFALDIVQRLSAACVRWTALHNIAFTLYGSFSSTVARRFAACLRDRFGAVPGLTDRETISNDGQGADAQPLSSLQASSFQVRLQQFHSGGGVSRIAVPGLRRRPEAALEALQTVYDHVVYAVLCDANDPD